ncbi:MAG: hypothetical protein MPJ78_04710 [Hyphomicrobiaceae bacterium]|nr:hypothetical protein [Hyphomicrobiaceae bacterium]
MKKLLIGTAAAAILAIAPFGPAKAEMTDVEVIFVKADKDGDFALDLGEVLVFGIAHFKESDANKDGKIDKDEAGEHGEHAEFSDNDANKDGALTMEEHVAEKIADFKDADKDGDGSLTIDEVRKHYEGN